MTTHDVARLGEIIVDRPKSKLKVRDAKGDGPYPFFTSGSRISAHDEFLTDGSNIYMATGGKANVQYYEGRAAYSTDCYSFTTREGVDPKFTFYFLESMIGTVDSEMFEGAALRHLQKDELRDVLIPLPQLDEQTRIVSTLDAVLYDVTLARENTVSSLESTEVLFQSRIRAMLDEGRGRWPELHLSDVALQFGRGKSKHRPRNDPKLYDGPYPFIQTGDISRADHWLIEHSQTYNEVGLAQSRLWPRGTVCIAIVGATVGESAILDFEACFPDSVIGVFVDDERVHCEYVEYLLQAYKAILKDKGKGTARDNINLGTFETQTFPFPPIEQQQQIVDDLNALRDHLRALAVVYRDKLAELGGLRSSLLHYAFAAHSNGTSR